MAKLDPEETFVTAQRIFGGVHPFFFVSCLSPAFASLAISSCGGAPTACSAARRSFNKRRKVGNGNPPRTSARTSVPTAAAAWQNRGAERPEAELSRCLLLRCLCCWRCCCFDCCFPVAATLSPLLFSSQFVKSHMPVTKVFINRGR